MSKVRMVVSIVVIAALVWAGYNYFTKSRQLVPVVPELTYFNLLNEVMFDLPNKYQPEDVTYPYGIALYENLSDEFNRTKSESDFLKSGGIYIKTMRQIPGTKAVLETFMKQDFEVKLAQAGKTLTSEMFVTDQGYDAFKTKVTSPKSEIHVVVNTPIAFWFVAQSDTPAYQRVYQSFKTFKSDEVVDVKKAVNLHETFIADLQNVKYESAIDKMSDTLKAEFSVDKLQVTFDSVQNRLNRKLHVFSVSTSGNEATIRSTLEDPSNNQYAFVSTNLRRETTDWKVDQFVLGEDATGLPYEQAMRNVKKEVKKEDLLKSN